MKFLQNPRIILAICLLLLLILLKVSDSARRVGYDHIPETYTILDERTYVWYGLSLRQTGVPAAWSDFRSYWDFQTAIRTDSEKRNFTWKGFNLYINDQKPQVYPRNFPEVVIISRTFDFGDGDKTVSMVQPFLDQPPFGSLVLSSMVNPKIEDPKDLGAYEFRKTSLFLANLTLLLIFIAGWLLFKNPVIGLLSASVYGTVPTFLLTSRLALLENVLIPLSLLTLILLLVALRIETKKFLTHKKILLILAGIFAGLAFLAKSPGIAVLPAGVIILWLEKEKWRRILFFAVPAIFLSSTYFIWGFFLAPHLFPQILIEGASKRLFVGSLVFIQEAFKFGSQNFPIDGWWIGSFLTLLFLKKSPQSRPLIVFILVTIFVTLFMGASSFAWYFLPLVPFLCLSTGLFLYKLITEPKIVTMVLFFLIFFSSTWFWSQGVAGASPNFINHQYQFLLYKIWLGLFFGATILSHFFFQKSQKFRLAWMLGVILVLGVCFAWNFRSFNYILAHWGTLQQNLSPNWTF